MKLQKKTKGTPITFRTSSYGILPPAKQEFIDLEKKLYTADREFLDLKESKNQLETLCYKYRDGLQGNLAVFMEDKAR